ncbi:amino acid:proton antiporter [Candidatus Epulonipiscium fishelsonii]|uniref:Amino acid:proton antiporter n=1 Tax=Candidatus Epulonipiscium fishelsonii TaxID=77094 RepID=A0ACC8XHV0_9FIRM|nr:amino acid:proton antiporter [Epulopiscium sp. SCG-D08WGA-EpuloA1]
MVTLAIELTFVWCIVFISFFPISDSVWILNGAAAIKIFLALSVGILGIYGAIKNGVANEYTVESLFPSFDINSLSFISVILFNFLGFEVVCTFTDDMENPKKQIPQAIIIGGIVIAAIYIFSAFGIGVAIPTEEISTSSGMIDSLQILTGQTDSLFIKFMAVLFLLTLVGNMVSWSLGINNTAAYAAKNGDMPKVFGKTSAKNNMPMGSSIINGIVASVVLIIAPFIPNEDLFWSFFALNVVMFLMAYIPVFPAFLKLRAIDGNKERPFKVEGPSWLLKTLAYTPMVIIIIALIFVAVPLDFSPETLTATLPITIGAILATALGEILIKTRKKGD